MRLVVFEEEKEEKEKEKEEAKEKEEKEREKEKEKGNRKAAAAAPAPAPPSSSSVIPPNEASIPVYGDYGTKVEAVVRRIKAILAADDEEGMEAEEEARKTRTGGGDSTSKNAAAPTATEPTMTKVLVFSTWVEALEIVAHALATNGVRAALAKGRAELGRTVAAFQRNKKTNSESSSSTTLLPPRVLLLPAKQGAAGLNLTEAQHVVFLEPWLDPAAEAQAVGRVHRIGQSKATVSFLKVFFLIISLVLFSLFLSRAPKNHSPFLLCTALLKHYQHQAVHRFAAERTVEEAVASLAAAKALAIGINGSTTAAAAAAAVAAASAAATGRGHGAKAMQTLSVGDVSALLGLDR